MPSAPISADQANSGTRRMVIPGARVVSTDVATQPAEASNPMIISP